MKASVVEIPIAEPFFQQLSDAQLLNAGMHATEVELSRSLTDPDSLDMMRFLEQLPEEAGALLLAYVTGSREQREEIAALLLKERELVSALDSSHMPAINGSTDTFIHLKDVPEEKRAFEELPFDDWMLYLHPDQRLLVNKEFAGPARLRCVSGSGKTVFAI